MGRLDEVETDTADACGEVDHQARATVGEHRVGGPGDGQVVLGALRRNHVRPALGQLGDHLPAQETGPSGHEDAPAGPERRHGDEC